MHTESEMRHCCAARKRTAKSPNPVPILPICCARLCAGADENGEDEEYSQQSSPQKGGEIVVKPLGTLGIASSSLWPLSRAFGFRLASNSLQTEVNGIPITYNVLVPMSPYNAVLHPAALTCQAYPSCGGRGTYSRLRASSTKRQTDAITACRSSRCGTCPQSFSQSISCLP